MNKTRRGLVSNIALRSFILIVAFLIAGPAFSYPVNLTDALGNNITIEKRPHRVVSLAPAVTEIIFRIGAGDAVKAITYHSYYPPETANKEIVGGFFSPSLYYI